MTWRVSVAFGPAKAEATFQETGARRLTRMRARVLTHARIFFPSETGGKRTQRALTKSRQICRLFVGPSDQGDVVTGNADREFGVAEINELIMETNQFFAESSRRLVDCAVLDKLVGPDLDM